MVDPIENIVTMEIMTPLFAKQDKLHEELEKVNLAIKSLQELCEHDYNEDGYDSHKTHYICKNCGHTASW